MKPELKKLGEFQIEEYPPNVTPKERAGFLLERMVGKILEVITIFKGWKARSICEDPQEWRNFRGVHSDHSIVKCLIECKNWSTGTWRSKPNADTANRQINSRFYDDDPNHRENWIAVISDISGFSDSMLDKIEADFIIDVGHQVLLEDDEEAFRTLFCQLVRKIGATSLLRFRDQIVNILMGAGQVVEGVLYRLPNSHSNLTLEGLTCGNTGKTEENKGPPPPESHSKSGKNGISFRMRNPHQEVMDRPHLGSENKVLLSLVLWMEDPSLSAVKRIREREKERMKKEEAGGRVKRTRKGYPQIKHLNRENYGSLLDRVTPKVKRLLKKLSFLLKLSEVKNGIKEAIGKISDRVGGEEEFEEDITIQGGVRK